MGWEDFAGSVVVEREMLLFIHFLRVTLKFRAIDQLASYQSSAL